MRRRVVLLLSSLQAVPRRRLLPFSLFPLLICATTTRAADDAPPPAESDKPTLEGDVKVLWRVLSGEGEGRFPQDVALKDGGRLAELNLRASDPRTNDPVDEVEMNVSGLGDPWSDATLALRKRGLFDVSGGWRRDESDYRASGDPFPYDLVRERLFVHGRWTPTPDFAVRFSWDANDRRGHAFTDGYDYFTLLSVGQRRSISQASDRFSLGADYATGVFRFGLTETIGSEHVDDSRFSADPKSSFQDLARVRETSKTYAATAKVSAALVEKVLDATLLVTRSTTPLDETTSGHDTSSSGSPSYLYAGDGRIRRDATDARLETSWRPHRDWEFVFAGEKDDVIDDESGVFTRGGGVEAAPHARVTDRESRLSADATWDATDKLRLRLGEQFLREELFVPTESHFYPFHETNSSHLPTDLKSNSLRTTAGLDWSPTKRLTISPLVRVSTNDAPQTTSVPDHSDEYSLRVRWKPADEWQFTTLARRQSVVHTGDVLRTDLHEDPDPSHPGRTTDLDFAGRTTSVSQAVAWTSGPWSVRANATYRGFSTSADSAWGGRATHHLHFQTTSFESADLVADLDARYAITKTLRAFVDATRANVTGDFAARWSRGSVGGEYDVRKDLTIGLTFSTWRLLDAEVPRDGYRAYGVETSLTWRF